MSFFFPVFSVIELAERNLLDRLPVDLYIFVFVPFGVFIGLGAVALFFGREKRRRIVEEDPLFK